MTETTRIAPLPAIVRSRIHLDALLGALNDEFPHAHVWASDAHIVYAVVPAGRARGWLEVQTLDADNPSDMRDLLAERFAVSEGVTE